ncbi:MAG: DNA translocase FtsK 4TM domain-containing protein, partial [Coriobacteriales bacterium]|nr:DNA translocase FtsK 4TM domain-containing protein [Coriobacteriales bacterium]
MAANKPKSKPASGKRPAAGSNSKAPAKGKASAAKGAHANAGAAAKQPLLDTRLKNDLAGVLIAVVAIALFIAVVVPGDAILSRAVASGLRLVLGVGAFVLPFILLAWGASFFVRQTFTNSTLRLGLGLGIIYLGVISLVAASTPGAASDPQALFAPAQLVNHGGYVGGGLAWALISLTGPLITSVVFAAFIIVGAVVIGFSVTGLVERVIAFFTREKDDDGQGAMGGAYDLGTPKAPAKKPGKKGVLIHPTAKLGTGGTFDDALYDDAYEDGTQGRIPLHKAGDLGATRRLHTNNDGAVEADADGFDALHSGATVLLDGRGAGANGKATDKGTGAKASGKGKAAASTTAPASTPAFTLPDPRILRVSRDKAITKAGANELRATADLLQATLIEFGVDGEVVGYIAGPTVTLYKVRLGEGVRLNKVTNLQGDIQLALAALAIRIVAPIPGTSLVGIEVPNETRSKVLLGDVLAHAPNNVPLQLAIGKDVEGDPITADLAKMPHLLIGGTTGSGKSVAINSMIMSVLMRATPQQVRMILIDPKRVELSLYNGIPHLYVPVVTDAQKAASALAWAVVEMERRLKVFEKSAVKNIGMYNEL